MIRVFWNRIIGALKVPIQVFTGHILCENSDNLMTEDSNNLTAE